MTFARKTLLPSLAIALCVLAAPRAEAGFGIGGSIGSGFYYSDGLNRTATNIEITPSWKIAILSLDLGLKFNLEEVNKQNYDFQLRPGVRLDLQLLYLRAAIPLRVNAGGDYGFLFGVGFSFGVGPVSLFVEADGNFSKEIGFSSPGIDFRLGARFQF